MASNRTRGVTVASAVIGIGLSGFFDGILLHQVLQWHHLLSLVPGEAFRDIGTQIFADGLFHVLMYIVTAAGLWLLWRSREQLAQGHASWQNVAGGGLLGFGIWNLIDVGLFHWILGIHRIRVDVPDPMLYDIGWLAVFGLVPGAIGWLLLRLPPAASAGRGSGAAVTLGLLALVAAPFASLPVPGSKTALVLFKPGGRAASAFLAARAAEAPILWMDTRGGMMAVVLEDEQTATKLYANGALLVSRSPGLAGCAAAIAA
jgi:uncharacterized membrane protein